MTLTQEDIQAIGTLVQNAIEPLATKDTVKEVVSSAKMELYDEMNRQYKENDKRFTKLESLSNTLILQSDNTALLLKLINRQAEELDALKIEVQEIKARLA